jgi:hypothetical protein
MSLKILASFCLNLKAVTNVNYFKMKEKKKLRNLFWVKKIFSKAKNLQFLVPLTKYYSV